MNDLPNSAIEAAEDDGMNTAAPNLRAEEWKMPKPVFQKTSGRLAKPFEGKGDDEISLQETSQTPSAPVEEPDAGPKNPVVKIVVVLLALAAMIAFIAAFLTVVYFFFLR